VTDEEYQLWLKLHKVETMARRLVEMVQFKSDHKVISDYCAMLHEAVDDVNNTWGGNSDDAANHMDMEVANDE
jgi:hypothetical protein